MHQPTLAHCPEPRRVPTANPHTRIGRVLLVVVVACALGIGVAAPAAAQHAELERPSTDGGGEEPDPGWVPDLGRVIAAASDTLREDIRSFLDAAAHAESARQERVAFWEQLAQCETGGNWQDPGQWAGGLGIYVGTWRTVGGGEFAPRPDQATKEQQIEVAERILDRFGIHAWGCARALGY